MTSGQNFNPVAITEIFKTQKMCFFVIFNCKPRKIQKVEILFLIIGQWSIYHKIRPRQMKSKISSPYLQPLIYVHIYINIYKYTYIYTMIFRGEEDPETRSGVSRRDQVFTGQLLGIFFYSTRGAVSFLMYL